MLRQEIAQLEAEIAQAQEALVFIESPQRFEPSPEQNSLLHDLRGLIAAEQTESDRVQRLQQAKSLLKRKQALLKTKQQEFDRHNAAAAIARQKLESGAAKLRQMIANFERDFNQTLLEMQSAADAAGNSLAELEHTGIAIAYDRYLAVDVKGDLPQIEIKKNQILLRNHWLRPHMHPSHLVTGTFPHSAFWSLLEPPQVEVDVLDIPA